ncbi:hypothetical protein PanWU01x14_036310, partial [Parasponia andersonii]
VKFSATRIYPLDCYGKGVCPQWQTPGIIRTIKDRTVGISSLADNPRKRTKKKELHN